jgi:hypothetical protein
MGLCFQDTFSRDVACKTEDNIKTDMREMDCDYGKL